MNNREHMRGPRPVRSLILLLLGLAVLSSGCPEASSSGGPVDACEKTGQQCRISDGKLGVCIKQTDGDVECQSQH